MQVTTSYLVCATPRSGSTLLCEALQNTGIAGCPEEFFEALRKTGLPRRPKEYFEDLSAAELKNYFEGFPQYDERPALSSVHECYAAYLAEVFRRGTTPNGVFGAKIMWGYLDDFIGNLRDIPRYRDRDLAVPDLLADVFPNLHYIWICRQDKVRQAISLWKAIQTWTWKHEENASVTGASSHPGTLVFHFQAINYLVQRIVAHEAAWQHYFSSYGIQPYTIVYEEFTSTYEETALNILQYLNIPLPRRLRFAERRMKQQADTLSEEWVQRYHHLKREQTAA